MILVAASRDAPDGIETASPGGVHRMKSNLRFVEHWIWVYHGRILSVLRRPVEGRRGWSGKRLNDQAIRHPISIEGLPC